MSYLINSIEKKRQKLIQLCNNKPLSDPEVVKLSQELDYLLNEYQKFEIHKATKA